MKPRALCLKLNEWLSIGLAEGIFLDIQPHTLQGPRSREVFGPVNAPGMISPGGIAPAEFLDILDKSQYSAIFSDGAILIIQCVFEDDSLSSHRYSYIPCPADPTLMALRPDEIPLSDWVRDGVFAGGIEAFRSLGTYRFDCVRLATDDTKEPHPTSHFTFASPDCRVPVKGPMSIADFLNFLFDNFYRGSRVLWLDHSPHLGCLGTDATITENEQLFAHLHWADAL